MKPAPFTYYAPRTIEEVIERLGAVAGDDGRILAGGQSLVPAMAFRLARPAHLIDINGVVALDRLEVERDTLAVGALVRHAAFHRPVVEGPLGNLLSEMARHIAHYPIRLRGTFCGSLANADPASEWCLAAVVLDAQLVIASSRGERRLAARDFFKGIMTTALQEDELLTAARLPMLAGDIRAGFVEFSRRAGDYALAMTLASYRITDGLIAAPRIGIGGAEALPRRIPEAEALLAGQPPSNELFRAAAEAAAIAIDPLEDIQADADYRRDLVRAVTRRALEQAAR